MYTNIKYSIHRHTTIVYKKCLPVLQGTSIDKQKGISKPHDYPNK